MPNDAFIPGGNVINREIKRFEAHSNETRTHFPFGRSISMACFSAILAPEYQSPVPDYLCHKFAGSAPTSSVEPFTTAVAPFGSFATGKRTAIFLQTNDDDIYRPHIRAICTENSPSRPVPMTNYILTRKNFDCCAMDCRRPR